MVKRQRSQVYLVKRLAEFDDDIEKEKGDEEFYRDRARWWSRRQREAQREADADDRDRKAEREEFDAKERASGRDPAKEAPVFIPEPEGFVVTRIMTQEERKQAIQELVAQIPVEKEDLWKADIKWKFMDDVFWFNLDDSLQETFALFTEKSG